MNAHNEQQAAVEMARQFHETYERLAPSFGYETRPETRQFDPSSPNGRLMIAVCSVLAASAVVKQNLTTQPAAAQEAVAWVKTKPTAEGDYYVRGFNLFAPKQYEALVQVRMHHFAGEPAPELVCNLHESTSSEDMDAWSPIVEMSDDFEWRGPLFAAPGAAAPVVPMSSDALDYLVEEVAAEHGEMLDDHGPSGWSFTSETLIAFAKQLINDFKDVLVADAYAVARAQARHDSTPAAPGIDIEHFHRAVQRICIKFDGDLPYISGIAEVLDLIDASPKGGSEARDAARWRAVDAAGSGVTLRLHSARPGERAKVIDAVMQAQTDEAPTYTTGHCENHKKPGGCPLHNLQCGYPRCDRRQAVDAEVQP